MPTFFVVLISIYLAGNIYIFRRGAQALVAQPFGVKVLLAVLFWCGALAFIGSFLARNTKLPVVLAHTAHEIGTGWLVFTLYMVLCLIIFDLFRLFNFPCKYGFYISLFLTLSLLSYGYYNYQHPKTEVFNIVINKQTVHNEQPLKVVSVSDVHLGYGTDKEELKQYVEMINAQKPDLILLDTRLPGEGFFQITEAITGNADTAEIPVVFIDAEGKRGSLERGFKLGCADYVRKPFEPDIMRSKISTQIELYGYRHKMEELLAAERQKVMQVTLEAIAAIAKTEEAKDSYTNAHSERVADTSVKIAKKLGWSEEKVEKLRYQALLHDIGKIGIPDRILNKHKNLTEKDSHSLSILLHSIGDFERISDHAINIKEAAEEMTKKDQHFSNKALVELEIFSNALKEVVDLSFDVFKTEDLTRAAQVEPLEEEIDYLQAELKRRHIKRLRKGKCTIEMGFILSDVLTNYERVADHCSNIAACLMEVNDDAFDIHEYKLDIENKEEFEMSFKKLKEKYMLP